MARRIQTLILAGANTSVEVRQGDIQLPLGKALAGIALKLTFPVKNTTGGNAAFPSGDKVKLLDIIKLTMKYGPRNAQRQPFQALGLGTYLRRLQRFAFGVEVYNYSDTSTGLGQTVNNNATNNLVATVIIPTGHLWMLGRLQNLFCMGRSQAKSVEMKIERGVDTTLTANWALNGNVQVDIFPLEVSVKGDRVAWIPEYRFRTERNYFADLDDGLPLLVGEETAAQDSSSLTRVNLSIDKEVIHQDASPADIKRELSVIPNYPSAALLTDDLTILYSVTPDKALTEAQSGPVHVEQPARDLSDFKLAWYFLPAVDAATQKAFLVDAANDLRRKTVKLTSLQAIQRLGLPSRMAAFIPGVLSDEQDAEFHDLPGLAAPYRGSMADVQLVVPNDLKAAARGAARSQGRPGDAAKKLATLIPTAANGGRGVSANTPDFVAIRNAVES